ncbi:hypothetical protein [Arachnia propionica]|uniref:hypothetical protein n=1 Tax=Arachnia propionica TaxID=1750 RepID=UPI000F6C254B|nr:hypothetical protein [Arachnia propionica]VEJ59663.1 Uncharacterised protein [Arachnia propionica]
MKHHFGGAAAVAVAVVLLLSSCGGQQPRPGSSDSESWGTAPQQPPRTTAAQPSAASSPSGPQPSETFTPEQLEAANTVIEYFRILDQTFSSLDADPQPLKDITTGQTQEMDINDLNDYRAQGKIQTGTVIVHILGSAKPKEVDGLQVTAIQICTDAENIDVIDSKTGKTVLKPGQRPPYLRWDINVVKIEDGWRVRETTNDIVSGCQS